MRQGADQQVRVTRPAPLRWRVGQLHMIPLGLVTRRVLDDRPIPGRGRSAVRAVRPQPAVGPVLPTLFNDLATWGPATVKLNGKPFVNPYDGPAPQWAAHTMTSIGARLPDGTVTANDGADVYNPQLADRSDTQPGDREVHVDFHDAPGPGMVERNFPPPFSFFYHVTFEDVSVQVRHTE